MKTKSYPVAVATWTMGLAVVKCAGEILQRRGNILDAVEKAINIPELDPNEMSVGYGGLPNEDGIVEVDAAIMHGPTGRAGSVMALRQIKTPISVARRVMERTKHVCLAGEGALQFAIAQGFRQEPLLTEKSLARWREWRENKDRHHFWNHDTIGLIVRDAKGNLAAGCSTSGIGFKIAGRVGDSPIIGAGLYVDNDVGAATATGVGEEIIRVCASFLAVELMRQGRSPQKACEGAIERLIAKANWRPLPMAGVIALSKDGRYGGASTLKGFNYAVWTPKSAEMQTGKYFYENPSQHTFKKTVSK